MPWHLGNSNFAAVQWLQWAMIPLLFWSLLWKGLALWHASKRDEKLWFAGLLVVNTMGILEILYLLFIVRLFRNDKISGSPVIKKRK